MKRDTILKSIPYVMIGILLGLLIILISCEKDKSIKEKCWICIDKYGEQPIRSTEIICDPVKVADRDGRRWEDNQGWHQITCKLNQ